MNNVQCYIMNSTKEQAMDSATDIVNIAIGSAPKQQGLVFGQFQADSGRGGGDGILPVSYNGHHSTFSVHIKRHLHNVVIDRLLADKSCSPRPMLVITNQIAAKHADRLRNDAVAFLDTAGNAFLDLPGLHLYISGNKSSTALQRAKPGRAFQSSGLKVLFAILTDPHLDKNPDDALLNQTFRTINSHTGVSLGSIGWVIRDLQDTGHLLNDGKMRLLVDRKNMLQKWVVNYSDRLRPTLLSRQYQMGPHGDAQFNIDLADPLMLWGGEVAGARLTGFLRPQTAIIYARNDIQDLILQNDLRPDKDGNVEILRMFWRDTIPLSGRQCVHPLLVYADLLASNIDRNMDTAHRIYDDYLRQIIEPD
jgi:hypothetical protein